MCPTEWTNFDGFSPAFFPTLPELIEKEIESAANSIRNAKKRRLLFDDWHRCEIGKALRFSNSNAA